MAGESAREAARRQREKAERLARSAEMWERGAEGEERTAAALGELPAVSWTVLHDVRWPGRKFANVDHVVVGPPGLFVIDSKNWSGTITIFDGVIRQDGRARSKLTAEAGEAARAVGQLVPLLRAELVVPVLCFVRDEPIIERIDGVMVASTASLAPMLMARPPALTDEERGRLVADLRRRVTAATAPALVAPRSTATVQRSFSLPAKAPRRRTSKKQSTAGSLMGLALVATFLFVPAVREGAVAGFIELMTPESSTAPTQPVGEEKKLRKACRAEGERRPNGCPRPNR